MTFEALKIIILLSIVICLLMVQFQFDTDTNGFLSNHYNSSEVQDSEQTKRLELIRRTCQNYHLKGTIKLEKTHPFVTSNFSSVVACYCNKAAKATLTDIFSELEDPIMFVVTLYKRRSLLIYCPSV